MIKTKILVEKNQTVDNIVTSEVPVLKDSDLDDFIEDNFDLNEFHITDEGILNL